MTCALPSCGFPRGSSDGVVRLAYGQRADGTIAHISEVPSGLACGCICPGCGADLVARKGDVNGHHFGHRSVAECAHALESALHKLAKEVLHDRREILLPEVGADLHGRTLVTHPADVHRFDEAILEHHMDVIVPDVIVRKGDHRLLVEMYVTHRCGPEKIARIRDMGLSCVEIDLRRMSRRATRGEVEKALLADARRYWINNPKLDQAATRLEDQIEQERQAAAKAAETARQENERRLDKLAQSLARRKPRSSPRSGSLQTATMRKVVDHGFRDLIGEKLSGDDCFACPPAQWQAEVVDRFVIAPLEQRTASYYDFHASDVFRHLKSLALLAPGVPDFVSKEDESALMKRVPGFRPPFRVIEDFLSQLEFAEILVERRHRWSLTDAAERGWSDRRKRAEALARQRDDIRSTVAGLLRKATEEERRGFDLDRWWKVSHPRIGISFALAFQQDDRRLTELSFVIHQLESLLVRNGKVVDDLFGLPLAGAIGREVDIRREKAEAERREAETQAKREADGRVSSLERDVSMALNQVDWSWMDAFDAALGQSPRTAAAASYDGLDRSRAALRLHAQAIERANTLARLRDKLLTAAAQTRRPEHARVFLTTPHPEWRGRHPIESCVDERSFETLKKRMAKIAG